MLSEISQNNFNKFRNRLINYSKKFKIQYEDLEEIVNDAILKAWKHFNNDRGSFESLCLVIIKNKIFNFTRDNAHLWFLVLIDENEDIMDADYTSFENKEENEMALNYLMKLKNSLDEDELKLFNEIYKMCGTVKKVSISNASRNIGLEPAKGWDLFRKIQRKAKHDVKKSEDNLISDITSGMIFRNIITDQDINLNKLLKRFSEDDLKKINLIYNF